MAAVQWTVPHWRDERALWEWGLRRAPQSSTPYTNLALVAVNGGDPAGDLALAEAALTRDPNADSAHNHRGLALFHLGRYEEAEAAFRRAIDLAPDNALYRSNLAGALREQGRLQEAERVLLDEALPRDPALWVAHLNLGLVYLRADRPDLAAQALEGALALAPPDQWAAVEATLRQTQEPARWLRLGDLLLANGEAEGALGALAQAEALGAAALDVAVGRSAALIALGRLDEAEALRDRRIFAAALDVTDPEPIPLDSPLLTLDNCLIVPHIASASVATRDKMARMAAENLLAGLRGERLPNCVNPEVYTRPGIEAVRSLL